MKQRTITTFALALGLMTLAACDKFQINSSKQYTEDDIKTAHHSLNIDDMTSADIVLGTSVESWSISALEANSPLLIEADTESLKDLSLSSRDQTVRLEEDNLDGGYTGRTLTWTVGLTREIPISLSINTGMGDGTGDLSGLQLTALDVNSGVGSVNLTLPVTEAAYPVKGNIGTGDFTFTVPDGAAPTFTLTGGAGSLIINVPDGAPVRVDANVGVGSIHLPTGYQRVSGDETTTGVNGVWESSSFEGAANAITIQYDGGVGDLTVQ